MSRRETGIVIAAGELGQCSHCVRDWRLGRVKGLASSKEGSKAAGGLGRAAHGFKLRLRTCASRGTMLLFATAATRGTFEWWSAR